MCGGRGACGGQRSQVQYVQGNEPSLPNFILKLWKLVNDGQHEEIVFWNPLQNGTSFKITDAYRFSNEVLPLYFRHNNLNSFIRQLNMYGFHKVSNIDKDGIRNSEAKLMEFRHAYFLQGYPNLLQYIKRKSASQVGGNKKDDAEQHSPVQHGGSGVQSPQNENPAHIRDFHMAAAAAGQGGGNMMAANDLCRDMQRMNVRQDNVEKKVQKLERENKNLTSELQAAKQMLVKQQQVMNRLVKCMLSSVNDQDSAPGMDVAAMKRSYANASPDQAKYARTPPYQQSFGDTGQYTTQGTQECQSGGMIRDAMNVVEDDPQMTEVDIEAVGTPSSPEMTDEEVVKDDLETLQSYLLSVMGEDIDADDMGIVNAVMDGEKSQGSSSDMRFTDLQMKMESPDSGVYA